MFRTVRQTWGLIGPQRRHRFIAVGALSTVVSGLEAVAAVLVAILLGFVLNAGEVPDVSLIGDATRFFPGLSYEELVLWSCATFLLFFVVRSAVFLYQQYALARVAQNTGLLLSDRLVDGYLSMPYEWHLSRNSSELIRNAYDNVYQMVGNVFTPMANLIADITLAVALLAVLFVSSPSITLVAGFAMGLAILVNMRVIQPRLQRLGVQRNRAAKATMQGLQQGFGGVRDIKILGREAEFSESFRRSRAEMAEAQYVQMALASTPRVTVEITFLLLVIGGLALAVSGDAVGSILPTLGLFAYAGLRLQPSIQKIAGAFNSLRYAEAAVEDVAKDLDDLDDYSSARRLADRELAPLGLRDRVRFESVAYFYPDAESPALRGVDLEIAAGESIGIAGATGGGKSTLLDLLCGLLPPTSGRILVDGADMAGQIRAWQRSLGVVHQSSFLIDDTIRRNIALGSADDEIDEAHLRRCVAIAQLDDVVRSLSEGLDTVTGERGIRLSGGQRQRITLARALYRKPSVLILDEGTASLDNETERRVIKEVLALGEITLFMVAHRVTTIEQCDRIIVVDKGRVVGIGTYREMVQASPVFRALATT